MYDRSGSVHRAIVAPPALRYKRIFVCWIPPGNVLLSILEKYMKNRIGMFLFSLLLSVTLISCGSGSGLLSAGFENQIPASSVSRAAQIREDEQIPIFVDALSMNADIDLVLVELRDNLGRLISDRAYEGGQLTFPNLPPLLLRNLPEGIYLLGIELFEDGESLGRQESWFYFYDRDIELSQITVNPHSAAPGELVSVGIELANSLVRSPYVQFRLNGMVVYEGNIDGSGLQFELDAPLNPGVYDLRLDIYPWFDSRIDNEIYSVNNHNLEMLVSETPDDRPQDEIRIEPQAGLRIDDDLFWYNDQRVATRLSLEADFDSMSEVRELFLLSGEGLSLMASGSQDGLFLELHRDAAIYRFRAEFDGDRGSERIIIDLLEGESHLTLVVTEGDRVIAGEIIDYRGFTPTTAEADAVEAREVAAPGLSVFSDDLSSFTLQSVYRADQLESLFKVILGLKYGNFVLYAEGFEFASAVNSAISYSENAFVSGGYLNLPPDSWVELPDFALDEYMVEIQTRFHPEDQLSDSSIVLLQEDGEGYREIFAVSGDGVLSSAGLALIRQLRISPELTFSLNRRDNRILLALDGEEFFFPAGDDGRYRFFISQDSGAELRIRLDSVSAANAPEEFVDRALDALPD
jgi:hypothetical protein